MKKTILFILVILFANHVLPAENQTGNLMGRVSDANTSYPLPNVNVIIIELEQGVYSNEKGEYRFYNIPVGNYSLAFQLIGYQTQLKTDIIIRSQRSTFINGELNRQAIRIEGIRSQQSFFAETEEKPLSVINFSSEEIRRAPGSAGDVSRIMMSLPSVAKVNDQSNNLIVRGGNPLENTFFIDNIEIPNINHFPHQGSSGGPIGILNVDFINDVTFNTGGFSVIYGDKLSSVMEIEFRDGNRQEFDGQLDFNMAGFGGILEAPLSPKSSVLIALKRSYLKYAVEAFDVGSSIAPDYGDVQGKLIYEFNPLQKLTFLGIFSDDHNSPDQENAQENAMSHFGNQDLYQGTLGVNWRSVWNEALFSKTSLAYTTSSYDEDFYETFTGNYAIRNRTQEKEFKLRNVNHRRFSDKFSLDFGLDVKHLRHEYDNWLAAGANASGDSLPEFTMKEDLQSSKAGVFLSLNFAPADRFSTTWGLRADYFSYNQNINLAPRLSCRYRLSEQTSLNAAYGIYFQNLPLLLLVQNKDSSKLADPRAIHYILGMEKLLAADTRLSIEIYQKEYSRFPLDPAQPGRFILDDDFFHYYEELTDAGRAVSRGVEVILQKKLAESIYGLASATYFRSHYKGLDGVWRNRNYDNRFIVSMEGGFKPSAGWEMSFRWIYAGGVPYTPLDEQLSAQYSYGIEDENLINSRRYPDYHSLNLRLDKRFFFARTNLVLYLSVWNAYNQQNIAEYFWNDKDQTVDEVYQWTLLPILGIEWEF